MPRKSKPVPGTTCTTLELRREYIVIVDVDYSAGEEPGDLALVAAERHIGSTTRDEMKSATVTQRTELPSTPGRPCELHMRVAVALACRWVAP